MALRLEGRKQGVLEWRYAWRGASRACLKGASLGRAQAELAKGLGESFAL